MSSYNPPRKNVPIFDAFLFRTTNDEYLTPQVAYGSFLQFPIAQGAETLQAISVNGEAVFLNAVPPTSNATQPASNDSSTKMPTTAWVQGAITDTTKTFTGVNTFSQNPLNTATQPASNDSSTIIPSTAWVQGAIALNVANLTYVNQTFAPVGMPTTSTQTIFPETLILPSAGTWLITGNYTINWNGAFGTTFSTLCSVKIYTGSVFTPTTSVDFSEYARQEFTGSFNPAGGGLFKQFSISKLFTIASPTTYNSSFFIDALNGGTIGGTASAIKISSV
jgi:hypothetical protein